MYRQPRYRLKKRARFAFVIVFVLALLTGGGLWAAGLLDEPLSKMGLIDAPEETEAYKGRLDVLVLGTDTRKGETLARADTIMLCSVDTDKNIMSVLSIPRDTRVKIPGHGWEKINSATVYGGPSLAMKLVSDLLGIRISNYVMVDYEGFKRIVDALGGVTIDVKKRMYHHDPEDGGIYTIDIQPGLQRLNGDKALQYVRYRDYALGDIDRAEQQQKFLAALVKEALQPSTVFRLPSLAVSTYKAVNTNLSLLEMKKLATAARNLTGANLITQTLPGQFLNMDGVSYWEPDPSLTRQVMASIYEGKAVSKVVLGEKTVTTEKSAPDGVNADGKVVPGDSGQSGTAKDPKTGTAGTSAKTGSSGKTNAGSGTKTGDTGKQVTGSKPAQGGGQSGGGIVPPAAPQQQDVSKEPPATVIIIPKTVAN
ncbi:MAG: LCP family protein [Peptococcaceae bacterium]|nr:LCP family protein [Peptococcaceae bacterium]